MKNVLFTLSVLILATLWSKIANFDIFLPTMAFLLMYNYKMFSKITLYSAIAFSFVGSYLWFNQIGAALAATAFIAVGFFVAKIVFNYSEGQGRSLKSVDSWLFRVLAVIVYDNIASIPMFYAAFMAGGISKLWSQILLGVPFTARHILSFVALYLGWHGVYNMALLFKKKYLAEVKISS